MLVFQRLTFAHSGAAEPLFRGVTLRIPAGWTGVVGVNGAGKTTLLKIACGILEPRAGRIEIGGRAVYCPQRTDFPPDVFDGFMASDDREARRLRRTLEIGDDWATRWNTLSHGERKRAQIAAVLWTEPEILAIDEPTNHIDADARLLLLKALQGFAGTGLLVSHDREMLDSLCARCLFVEPPDVVMRPGGYTAAAALAAADAESESRRREVAVQAEARVGAERDRRLREAAAADRRCSKRGLARGDHDGRARINLARVTGKDGGAGRLAEQLQGRLDRIREDIASMRVEKEYRTGIWLETGPARRATLFSMPAGEIRLGPGRSLRHPELTMTPAARVALTGANGSGKSTLVGRIVAGLELPSDRVLFLPQEISALESARLIEGVRALSREQLGRVLTIVSRLGSRPPRLMDTVEPSPGEMRKIMLAMGVVRSPWLIVMDEPTNHLDLPAIECMEEALAGCPCGLLLVSHDKAFLERLSVTSWRIDGGSLVISELPGVRFSNHVTR